MVTVLLEYINTVVDIVVIIQFQEHCITAIKVLYIKSLHKTSTVTAALSVTLTNM